jgi:hypothetical protein
MTQFQTGKTYATRSICDYDCIFSFEVIARTAKRLTLRQGGRTFQRGIYIYNGIEKCKPLGTYSMCPVIGADSQREAA